MHFKDRRKTREFCQALFPLIVANTDDLVGYRRRPRSKTSYYRARKRQNVTLTSSGRNGEISLRIATSLTALSTYRSSSS
jgi:hypothetical protein